jgi:putative transposase
MLGVSIRRMEKLVGSLSITSLSKSQASEMAKECQRTAQLPSWRTVGLLAGGQFISLSADN